MKRRGMGGAVRIAMLGLSTVALSWACDGSRSCVPGATNVCFCTPELRGVQRCEPDRTYGTCSCEGEVERSDGGLQRRDGGRVSVPDAGDCCGPSCSRCASGHSCVDGACEPIIVGTLTELVRFQDSEDCAFVRGSPLLWAVGDGVYRIPDTPTSSPTLVLRRRMTTEMRHFSSGTYFYYNSEDVLGRDGYLTGVVRHNLADGPDAGIEMIASCDEEYRYGYESRRVARVGDLVYYMCFDKLRRFDLRTHVPGDAGAIVRDGSSPGYMIEANGRLVWTARDPVDPDEQDFFILSAGSDVVRSVDASACSQPIIDGWTSDGERIYCVSPGRGTVAIDIQTGAVRPVHMSRSMHDPHYHDGYIYGVFDLDRIARMSVATGSVEYLSDRRIGFSSRDDWAFVGRSVYYCGLVDDGASDDAILWRIDL